MKFELLPTIDLMIDFYQKPLNIARFRLYLKMLQGDSKDNLVMPISGYNPMAKEHVLKKLLELKELKAENLANEIIEVQNKRKPDSSLLNLQPSSSVKVALNLSDDLKGGWTNRYVSDYDSKFNIKALVDRNFCVPIFWVSEDYASENIKQRIAEYIQRTIWWGGHSKPSTLQEHVDQEEFVFNNTGSVAPLKALQKAKLTPFYQKNKDTEEYAVIFNFFYGDEACKLLEYPCFGISSDMAAFDFVSKKE